MHVASFPRRFLCSSAVACVALVCLLTIAPRSLAQDAVFNTAEKPGQSALIGTFYDLKQDQLREPTTVTARSYRTIIIEFFQSNWDETVLNRYFRVTHALYTTQIFIPTMNSDDAPKAFGVSAFVKPRMWVANYKGQISPPEDGIYRFVGNADDILAISINDRLVLVAGRPDCLPPPSIWHSSVPDNRDTTFGDWISLKAGQIVDFQAITGDRPGGQFRSLLWIEKQGAAPAGRLPIFKLAHSPAPSRGGDFGPDTSWSVWSAKQ